MKTTFFWKNYHFGAKSSFSEFGLLVGIAFIIKEKEYHDATACSNPGSNLAISQKIQKCWLTPNSHRVLFIFSLYW